MDNCNLYKLPKDVLVFLISTIQSDLKKELDNSKRIFDTIREKSQWLSVEQCSHKGCHRFWIFEEQVVTQYDKVVDYYNDGRITFCNCICDKHKCDRKADQGIGWWCEEHVPSSYMILGTADDFNFVCNKCTKEGHEDE